MPTTLYNTSVVITGAWNPLIITPQWLRKYEVVAEAPEKAKRLLAEGPFAFEFENLHWASTHDRLAIASSQGVNCGVYAARILDLLPHTPVQAVGSNFQFTTPESDWPAGKLPRLGDLSLGSPSPLAIKQVRWDCAADIDSETMLNFAVAQTEKNIVVCSFNFHRNSENPQDVARFAKRWEDDYRKARGLLKDLFNISG
jgi:hypothetical protein